MKIKMKLFPVTLLLASLLFFAGEPRSVLAASAARNTGFLSMVFGEATAKYGVSYNPKRKFIVVSQALPDTANYLEMYSRLGQVAAVIPKSSKALFPENLHEWEVRGFPVRADINRTMLEDANFTLEFLRQTVGDAAEFYIIDHGGYFASVMQDIQADPLLGPKCKGAVESTRSGTTAYQSSERANHIPLLNVYDTEIKKLEGTFIGSDFILGLDQVLDKLRIPRSDIRTVGVLGLGLTGMPIFRGVKNAIGEHVKVLGYDKNNPDQAALDRLLRQSDLIISATGANAITDEDFSKVKSGVYLAVITSVDEELDLPRRLEDSFFVRAPEDYQLSNAVVRKTRVRYATTYLAGGKPVHLLLGYPLNYVLRRQDPGIGLIHATKMTAAIRLMSRSPEAKAASFKADEKAILEQFRVFHGRRMAAFCRDLFASLGGR